MINMKYNCKICGTELELSETKTMSSHCIFLHIPIVRYVCPHCNVIFGTIELIETSEATLKEMYVKLYSTYKEGYSVDIETKLFHKLSPVRTGKYLNYGSGTEGNTNKNLRDLGYDIFSYEPFAYSGGDQFVITSKEELLKHKFDGVISHNVIEHLQDPVKEFKLLKSVLNPDALVIHSTECYNYMYEFSAFHLYFFQEPSVRFLAANSGYVPIDMVPGLEYGFKPIWG